MHEACLKSPLCTLLAITNLFFFLFTRRRVLPTTFLKRRLQGCDRTKKHVKLLIYNRDIICLPKSSKSKNGDIKIQEVVKSVIYWAEMGYLARYTCHLKWLRRKSWMKSAQYLQRQWMMIRISDLQTCKQLLGIASYLPSPSIFILQVDSIGSGREERESADLHPCRTIKLEYTSCRVIYCWAPND